MMGEGFWKVDNILSFRNCVVFVGHAISRVDFKPDTPFHAK